MSIVKTAFWLSVVIMLLPTDQRRQTELASVTGQAVERTMTFCERNPGTCAAGQELWATFVRKAEFGIELAMNLAREQWSKQASRPQQPAASGGPVRLEPVRPQQGSLTPADTAPQWRGPAR